jgi:hypothetical protein
MAVEVIGKDPALYRKASCGKCASELRFVLADVQKRSVSDYTGCTDIIHFVVCPCCSSDVVTRGY